MVNPGGDRGEGTPFDLDDDGEAAGIAQLSLNNPADHLPWLESADDDVEEGVDSGRIVAFALIGLLAVVALVYSPSSTAVDRVALFFSVIQMAAFGEFRDLSGTRHTQAHLVRLMLIAVAIAVQSVWLIFGTHAEFWVPYRSVLELL